MKKKTYISGPLAGVDPTDAMMVFREAEVRLFCEGRDVVNPVRLCSSGWDWGRSMRVRLSHLLGCDAIYMLKGWKGDRGSRLEHFVALKLGMEITVEK